MKIKFLKVAQFGLLLIITHYNEALNQIFLFIVNFYPTFGPPGQKLGKIITELIQSL